MSSKVYVYSLQGVPFLDPLPRWLSEFQNILHPYTFSEYFHLSFRNFMTAFATASYDLGYVPNLISRWCFDEPNCLVFRFFQLFIKYFTKQLQPKNMSQHIMFWKRAEKQQQNQPLKWTESIERNWKNKNFYLQSDFYVEFANTFFACSHHKEVDTVHYYNFQFISFWNSNWFHHFSLHLRDVSGTFSGDMTKNLMMDWRHRLS